MRSAGRSGGQTRAERRVEHLCDCRFQPAHSRSSNSVIPTQHTLISRLRAGTSDADWEKFYAVYERPLLAFAAWHSLGESDCWDVLQETMVKMLRGGFARFEPGKGPFSGFLFNVAKGCVIDAIRRRNRREARHLPVDCLSSSPLSRAPEQRAPAGDNPAEAAERCGQMALVAVALDYLIERRIFKPRTVAIFRAVTLDGMETREVARRFNTSAGNVYEAKRAVLARLRRMLQGLERGLDLKEALEQSKEQE